jgi:hypothetical protein
MPTIPKVSIVVVITTILCVIEASFKKRFKIIYHKEIVQ